MEISDAQNSLLTLGATGIIVPNLPLRYGELSPRRDIPRRRFIVSGGMSPISHERRVRRFWMCARTCRSPGASSAGNAVASGEPCPAPAAGTTSRRNRRWPRAWHPGPNDNPAGRRTELEEPELRTEGGVAGPAGREKEGDASGERATEGVARIDINPIRSIQEQLHSFLAPLLPLPLPPALSIRFIAL